MKYKHSEVFAEVKTIKEDIQCNLTSLQYLQILDYYLWNSLYFVVKIAPQYITNCITQAIAYQQKNVMVKISSDSKEQVCCNLLMYLSTNDIKYIKEMHLNRGIYFGIISNFLSASLDYFDSNSPFSNEHKPIPHHLFITNENLYFAHFKQTEYWFDKALNFKSKIMQKYVRFTILQAQKAYVDFAYKLELDDITQIYLQVMSKAIDRCDSRFGVLTSFIQNWLKSARAQVQKIVEASVHCESYDSMIDEFGDCVKLGTIDINSMKDAVEELAYYASLVDSSGCLRLQYGIPQYASIADKQLLEETCKQRQST